MLDSSKDIPESDVPVKIIKGNSDIFATKQLYPI